MTIPRFETPFTLANKVASLYSGRIVLFTIYIVSSITSLELSVFM